MSNKSWSAHEPERLLKPADVAEMFGVDPKTVGRWASTGKLSSIRTLGGHRRFHEAEVQKLLTLRRQRRDG